MEEELIEQLEQKNEGGESTEPQIIPEGTVTVKDVSKKSRPSWVNPNNVTFVVKYGKGWGDKPKPMPEGPVVVSKETADHFTKLGIGSILI